MKLLIKNVAKHNLLLDALAPLLVENTLEEIVNTLAEICSNRGDTYGEQRRAVLSDQWNDAAGALILVAASSSIRNV